MNIDKQSRGLTGNRNAQGDFEPEVATDPNVQLKQEAMGMEDAELEQLAAQLSDKIESSDEAEAAKLQGRLDIVNEVIESRLQEG
jgi:hypothetical protein